MIATLCVVLLAAAPAASTPAETAASAEVPRVADAGWSVGAAIGQDAAAATIERRLLGRVWASASLAADLKSDEATGTEATPGEATLSTTDVTSGWNAGGGLRFRLQLLPDDAFLRPSLFLGADVNVATTSRELEQLLAGDATVEFTRTSFTTTVEGNFGVLLDFTLLPWLALRAGSTLVNGGYRSVVASERLDQEDLGTQTTSTTTGGVFGGVNVQPSVGLQAFF